MQTVAQGALGQVLKITHSVVTVRFSKCFKDRL